MKYINQGIDKINFFTSLQGIMLFGLLTACSETALVARNSECNQAISAYAECQADQANQADLVNLTNQCADKFKILLNQCNEVSVDLPIGGVDQMDMANDSDMGLDMEAAMDMASNSDMGFERDMANASDMGAAMDMASNSDMGAAMDMASNSDMEAAIDMASNSDMEAAIDMDLPIYPNNIPPAYRDGVEDFINQVGDANCLDGLHRYSARFILSVIESLHTQEVNYVEDCLNRGFERVYPFRYGNSMNSNILEYNDQNIAGNGCLDLGSDLYLVPYDMLNLEPGYFPMHFISVSNQFDNFVFIIQLVDNNLQVIYSNMNTDFHSAVHNECN